MSIEAMKAIQMVYANTTKHDWPDDIWDAICQAIEAEKQERGEPVDLSSFLCGYAQIKDGQYKFANMRTVELLTKDEFGPIYAIPEELIDSLYTHPQPKREPLLVFAQECVLGAYRESELADAAQRAIKAAERKE